MQRVDTLEKTEGRGTTEHEMVGRHHRLDGHKGELGIALESLQGKIDLI